MSRFLGRYVVDLALADADGAGGHLLESGDRPQQRRLPVAGGADEHHQRAIRDLEVHGPDGLRTVVVDLPDLIEEDVSHRLGENKRLRDGPQLHP
jgi:hypothetical protein